MFIDCIPAGAISWISEETQSAWSAAVSSQKGRETHTKNIYGGDQTIMSKNEVVSVPNTGTSISTWSQPLMSLMHDITFQQRPPPLAR